MTKEKRPALSELERTIMNVIWKAGKVTADQIRIKLSKTNPLKDSTVRTILRRLETKGYVCHETEARTFVYSAVIAKPSVATDAVVGIVNKYCAGSVENLLLGMVENKMLTPQKLKKLADKIAKADRAQAANKKSSANKN